MKNQKVYKNRSYNKGPTVHSGIDEQNKQKKNLLIGLIVEWQ